MAELVTENHSNKMVDMRRVVRDRDYGIAPTRFHLPDQSRLGRICLQIGNLSRSIDYYRDLLGFTPIQTDDQTALMHTGGDAQPLIELHQEPKTRPVPKGGVLGLYHFAILLPDRPALGRFVAHLYSQARSSARRIIW